MKVTRKKLVDHFMEDFIKECRNKFPELDEKDPMYIWMIEQYRFKLERLLTIIIMRNPLNKEDEIYASLSN